MHSSGTERLPKCFIVVARGGWGVGGGKNVWQHETLNLLAIFFWAAFYFNDPNEGVWDPKHCWWDIIWPQTQAVGGMVAWLWFCTSLCSIISFCIHYCPVVQRESKWDADLRFVMKLPFRFLYYPRLSDRVDDTFGLFKDGGYRVMLFNSRCRSIGVFSSIVWNQIFCGHAANQHGTPHHTSKTPV
jgi:hypothetical protein